MAKQKIEQDMEMDSANMSVKDKMENLGLNAVKRKQIFKKDKAKALKAMIQDLKVQSKKLKKRDLIQKAEKKKIAKQIKMLKL